MTIASACLEFLTTAPSASWSLERCITEFVRTALGGHDVELWAEVCNDSGERRFALISANEHGNSDAQMSRCLASHELADRLSKHTAFEVKFNAPTALARMPLQFVVAPVLAFELTSEERLMVQRTLEKLCVDHLRGNMRHTYELVMQAAQQSKDLTSFFNRLIHTVVVRKFRFSAGSMFYFEAKTKSLILGSTTGIRPMEEFGIKRSNVRYFVDSKSFTAKSFIAAKEIIENSDSDLIYPFNRWGESSEVVRNRINIPLRRWTEPHQGNSTTGVGMLRAVNANAALGYRPLTTLDIANVKLFCAVASVFAERYIRNLSILHDQERATHGFNTDLAAIKYAAENVSRWLTRFEESGPEDARKIALSEIRYRVKDILAVQDNMASQILTVLFHSGNGKWAPRKSESALCTQPYKDIVLRLMSASKGMSECFGRPPIKITFSSTDRAEDKAIQVPALNISVGSLYLVFRNIAENAIKYSKKGIKPRLDISWSQADKHVDFTFKDNGIGIPRSEWHLVFREGFRGRRAQELQLRGNGLGLAVSQEVMRRHNGRLDFRGVENEEDGCTFTLRVPTAHQ